jgi:heme-degrading monooxygenase HmoA
MSLRRSSDHPVVPKSSEGRSVAGPGLGSAFHLHIELTLVSGRLESELKAVFARDYAGPLAAHPGFAYASLLTPRRDIQGLSHTGGYLMHVAFRDESAWNSWLGSADHDAAWGALMAVSDASMSRAYTVLDEVVANDGDVFR